MLHLTRVKLPLNVSGPVSEANIDSTCRSVELILPIASFLHQLGNIPVQTLDDVLRSLNGRLAMLAPFPLPAPDTVFLFGFAVILDFELVADSALRVDMDVLHHKLHTAGLASAVLLGAMLAERPPFEVAALIDLLVKEAHVVVKLWRQGQLPWQSFTRSYTNRAMFEVAWDNESRMGTDGLSRY
jgi:hypothetical protein